MSMAFTVEQARASLRRFAAPCSNLDDGRVAQAVCVGNPVAEVALAACHADLLVMGARKVNPLRDFVFGAATKRTFLAGWRIECIASSLSGVSQTGA